MKNNRLNPRVFLLFGLLFFLITACEKEYFRWSVPEKAELNAVIINIGIDVITIKGEIVSDNIGLAQEVGFLITSSGDFSIADKYLVDIGNSKDVLFEFQEFEYNTTYEARFFIMTTAGLSQSKSVTFVTSNIPGSPSVVLNSFSDVSLDNLNVFATVTLEGNAPVVSRGFCWSTSPNPTMNNSSSNNGSGTGNFSQNITNLNVNTTYFIRAYATNQIATSYSNQLEVKTKNIEDLAFGDFFQGGLLFHIFQPGEAGFVQGETHGLIAAPIDQGNFEWGCSGTSISTSENIGNGQANTQAIVASCGQSNTAARTCDNLSLNGYNDWFLPSSGELQLMRQNLHQNNVGSFNNALYWSSHQFSPSTAAAINFNLSGTSLRNDLKELSFRVRSIRKF